MVPLGSVIGKFDDRLSLNGQSGGNPISANSPGAISHFAIRSSGAKMRSPTSRTPGRSMIDLRMRSPDASSPMERRIVDGSMVDDFLKRDPGRWLWNVQPPLVFSAVIVMPLDNSVHRVRSSDADFPFVRSAKRLGQAGG